MYKIKLALYDRLTDYYVKQYEKAMDRIENYILFYSDYKRYSKKAKYYGGKAIDILEKRQQHKMLKAWVS